LTHRLYCYIFREELFRRLKPRAFLLFFDTVNVVSFLRYRVQYWQPGKNRRGAYRMVEGKMYKRVPVEESVGMVLGHDVTRIVPGEFKGPGFKKGHIIKDEDIPALLDMGKKHVYILELGEAMVHENDAAERIARAAAGKNIKLTGPSEGRIDFIAAGPGLLKINVDALLQINMINEVILVTMHTNQQVASGNRVAGTRIIPLVTQDSIVSKVEQICGDNFPVIDVKPFRSLDVGLITTGNEVYSGRITDKFGPVIEAKFAELGCRVVEQVFVPDEIDRTVQAIHDFVGKGVDLIALTGGMSVDPDDQTPAAIKAAGAEVVIYGVPVLPGAMFMLARIGDIPVVGLPGCVLYYRATIFDLIIPRIVAGEEVTAQDIIRLGHGGFCPICKECRYPMCPFGKGY
jgi:molybdenum cofactor synthesis domain-containing protein